MVRLMIRNVCIGEYANEHETKQARRYYRRAGIFLAVTKWEGKPQHA